MTATVAVKICGIADRPALEAAVEHGADWIGFNLHPRSPRYVTAADAGRLASLLPPPVRPVALLVAPDDALVDAVLDALPGAILQIYAGADRVAAVRARSRRETWHAVPLGPEDAPPDATAADRLVMEAAPRPDDVLPGGNGHRLDWSRLRSWRPPVPWLLAGGLTPGNVRDAVDASGAVAVDVASGVERARGVKDPALIGAFLRAAKER